MSGCQAGEKERLYSDLDLDRFCFFPFMQLLLQPTGVVSPCCWNQKIVLGEIQKKNLLEIWNDEPMRELRRQFLEGKPVACEEQMRHIGCHRWSGRSFQTELAFRETQPAGPRRLDVRLNGQCNLQCVMCDVWKQPNGLYNASDFWSKGPTEIFPHLLEMDVLGGEPFIQADTYRLMDEISACNSRCSWAFVTNGQYKFNQVITRRLDKISIRWMQISLDSIRPETYAKIRLKGQLSRAMETFEGLRAYWQRRIEEGRGFKFVVTMCVQQENWREIPEFLDFALSKGVDPVLQFAYEPHQVSLLSLPLETRREIATAFLGYSETHGAQHLKPVLLPVRDSLNEARPQPPHC